jgi:hypothetical protein
MEERVLWIVANPHKRGKVIWAYEKVYELMVVLKKIYVPINLKECLCI